jgi:Mce-associated membrane protein
MSDDAAANNDTTNADSAADDTTAQAEASAQDETAADTADTAAKDVPASDAAAEDSAPVGDTEAPAQSSPEAESVTEDATVTSRASAARPATSEDAAVKRPAAKAKSGSDAAVKSSAGPDPDGPKRGWVPIAGAFAAGVVMVAVAAAVTVFGLQAHDRGSQLATRDSAVSAACDFGRQVGTYDSKSFDDYVNRVKQRSTGDWLTQFDGASSALKQITEQAQARSTVSEIHCAWEFGDANNASVVMLITQNQSKAATPQPQHLTIGVVASLTKKDGTWLVSNFQSPMTNDLQSEAPAPGAGTPSVPGTGTTPGN